MIIKTLSNEDIKKKTVFALSDAYRAGETIGKLVTHMRLKGGEARRFHSEIHPELEKDGIVKIVQKGNEKYIFLPENEKLARKKFGIGVSFYGYPDLDFKSDINEWHSQLQYWDEFFTPWIHFKKRKKAELVDSYLRLELSLSYQHFRKYVKDALEKNPNFCQVDPFEEQIKLKKMIEPFNELRNKLLDEFETIMDSKMLIIESKLPDFDKNFKHQLLQLIFMRKTSEFLEQQNFNEPFLVVIKTPKNKNILYMVKNKKLAPLFKDKPKDVKEYMIGHKEFTPSFVYKPKDIKDVFNLLSDEIDKSPIITKELMVKLWTMISESQQICGRIMRALKLFYRIK